MSLFLTDRLRDLQSLPLAYANAIAFPHIVIDDALDPERALNIQQEILSLPSGAFDRYNNPFEQKYTLRDKHAYPPALAALMEEWTSDAWLKALSDLVGAPLKVDPDRNFWGVHVFRNGDKLDIHLDAGQHPRGHGKKWVTAGLYLSKDWQDAYGGALEVWHGDRDALTECAAKYAPRFNRMFIFTNVDNSWHGSPDAVECPPHARRILVTLSYLTSLPDAPSEVDALRKKALFAPRPGDAEDPEKEKARWLRANPSTCHLVYDSLASHRI